MPWQDRLREAAYTSPSGTRTVFAYEDVRRTIEKHGSEYIFPDTDGSYIQDLGSSGRRYPFRIFFTGDDHDITADAFFDSLTERGQGILEHPRYGRVNVVPFGSINQRDNLKTAANQTIIELTFFETTGLVYPSSQNNPSANVVTSVEAFNISLADEFATTIGTDTVFERTTVENQFRALLDVTKNGLQTIADTQDDVRQQFDNAYDSINNSLDVLIEDPVTLVNQLASFMQLPSLAVTSITDRLLGFAAIIETVLGADISQGFSTFLTANLYGSSAVTGSVLSVVNNEFETKVDAIEAAEVILDQFDSVSEWRENGYVQFTETDAIDTGASYQDLQNSVATAAGFLVEISFSLKQERRLTISEPRTIIDLAAEIYNTVDVDLDFLIQSNNLTGSEILELPTGREIVFYV